MAKKKRPHGGHSAKKSLTELEKASRFLQLIALREGIPVEQVRKQIQLAMLGGLASRDPAVKARWQSIPRAGDVPTPEEVIAHCAGRLRPGRT